MSTVLCQREKQQGEGLRWARAWLAEQVEALDPAVSVTHILVIEGPRRLNLSNFPGFREVQPF